jgi:hypothetical protein
VPHKDDPTLNKDVSAACEADHQPETPDITPDAGSEQAAQSCENSENTGPEAEIARLTQALSEQNDRYLRLLAEYDNYRYGKNFCRSALTPNWVPPTHASPSMEGGEPVPCSSRTRRAGAPLPSVVAFTQGPASAGRARSPSVRPSPTPTAPLFPSSAKWAPATR